MIDDPKTHPPEMAVIAVSDTAHAPFIFYEWAPSFGCMNGVINVTLAATRSYVGPAGIVNEQVVVAYLRGNIQAALGLRKAIDDALLMAAPTTGEKAN